MDAIIKGGFFLMLLAALLLAGYVVTEHANQVHEVTGLSRLEGWQALERNLPDPEGKGFCTEVAAASCPNAVCRDPKSCNLGKPNPVFILMCRRPAGHWEAPVFSLSVPPRLITYIAPTSKRYLQQVITRDGCLSADWTFTMRLLGIVR